jgi:small subunit ribosomal protein S11
MGWCYVQASFNNTIVTITDMNGNVLSWKSSGRWASADRAKERRLPRSRPRSNAANMARDHGMRSVDVRVSGPGSGRESAVRALAAVGHRSPLHPRRHADSA